MTVICEHKQATHVCGTHTRYVLDMCRCDDCKAANSAYERQRLLWNGDYPVLPHPYVDAGPARRHVRGLMGDGMGWMDVARTAGVSNGLMWKLLWGKRDTTGRQRPSKQIRRENSEALRAVRLTCSRGAFVDPKEAWLIVGELVRRGWAKAAIAREVLNPRAVSLQMSRTRVKVSTLVALRKLLYVDVPPQRTRYGLRPVNPVEPRFVKESTKGVPSAIPVNGTGTTSCAVCAAPLASHKISDPPCLPSSDAIIKVPYGNQQP